MPVVNAVDGCGEVLAAAQQVIEVGGEVWQVGHVGAEVVTGPAQRNRIGQAPPPGGDVGRLGAPAVGHGDLPDRVAGVLGVQQHLHIAPDPVAVPVELQGRNTVDGLAAAVFAD